MRAKIPLNRAIDRLLTGIGAGIGLCVGPIFISEIAPPKIRGSVGRLLIEPRYNDHTDNEYVGVLTQFAIVIGLMITQALVANGAKVYITSRRDEVLDQTVDLYNTGPGQIIP